MQLPLVLLIVGALALAGCAHQRGGDLRANQNISTSTTMVAPTTSTALELKPPVRTSRSARRPFTLRAPAGDLYYRLAMCESGMNRYARSGPYHSYFQWLLSTWRNVSGLRGAPEDYEYTTQVAAVARIPVLAWHRQFPVCSRRIGI